MLYFLHMKGEIPMIVLYIILAILLVLTAVLLINTALQTRSARKLEGQHPTFTEAELEVYGKTFSRMLQSATISVKDSYDDTEFAKLRAVVRKTSPCCTKRPSAGSWLTIAGCTRSPAKTKAETSC